MLTMELNLKTKQLIYYVDDECYGVAFQDVKTSKNIKYKLAVSLCHNHQSMKIIKFQCI